MFNLAGFSNAFDAVVGIDGTIDGVKCEAMLTGRPWVEQQQDGCHWKTKEGA